MTGWKISPSSGAASLAARVVCANPGATLADVARIAGRSVSHAGSMLRAAEEAGLIALLHMGRLPGQWFPVGQIAAARVAERERRAQVRSERNSRHKAAQGVPATASEDAPDELLTVVQRQVPADAPLPFKCRAARSVFEWGAA